MDAVFANAILLLIIPALAWVTRKLWAGAITKVITDAMKPQMDLFEKKMDQDQEYNVKMFEVMNMHIEELVHFKEKHEELEKKVEGNTNEIEKLKNAS